MKRLLFAAAAVVALVLSASAVRADPGGRAACCAPACPTPITFNLEESSEKCQVPVRVENKPTVQETTTTKQVPCTRYVTVTVKDCNGCCHTEMHPETYMKEVKVTTLTVVPPAERFTCKMEDKVTTHVRVSISEACASGCCGK